MIGCSLATHCWLIYKDKMASFVAHILTTRRGFLEFQALVWISRLVSVRAANLSLKSLNIIKAFM